MGEGGEVNSFYRRERVRIYSFTLEIAVCVTNASEPLCLKGGECFNAIMFDRSVSCPNSLCAIFTSLEQGLADNPDDIMCGIGNFQCAAVGSRCHDNVSSGVDWMAGRTDCGRRMRE